MLHGGRAAAKAAATDQGTTNAVAAANVPGVARLSGSSDREIGSLWNVVVYSAGTTMGGTGRRK